MFAILIVATLSPCLAGQVPYFGQTWKEVVKQTRLPLAVPQVSEKQLADNQNFHNKFFDVANAFAQGYQAAMRDIQSRSVIPRPMHAMPSNPAAYLQSRSFIPPAPVTVANVPRSTLESHFAGPKPNDITVGGSEKSIIPHPDFVQQTKFEGSSLAQQRATMNNFLAWQQQQATLQDVFKEKRSPIQATSASPSWGKPEGVPSAEETAKRSEIARLNQAALHRNVYFDAIGGDPYTGSSGVLTRQNIWLKHRRAAEDDVEDRWRGPENALREALHRHRRSRMPYLGQNLDNIGVVRAKPNWEAGNRKSSFVDVQTIPEQSGQYQYQPAVQYEGGLTPQSIYMSGTARSDVPMMQAFQAWAQLMKQQQSMRSYQLAQTRVKIPVQAQYQQPHAGFYPAQEYAGFIPYYYQQSLIGKPQEVMN